MLLNIASRLASEHWGWLTAQTREPEPYGSPLWSYLAFILVAFVVLYLVVKGIRK